MNSLNFYFRLALSNIKKNKRLYIPHILAGAGSISIFFIMMSIFYDPNLLKGKGGSYLPGIMAMGAAVTGILSAVLLFYTNSFLMKQRKREFGLYNVLGMDKRNIGRVLFFENTVSSVISIIIGLGTGLVFYKLCVLFICSILRIKTIMGFYISIKAMIAAAVFFMAVYMVNYAFNRLQIQFLRPVEMMGSTQKGEKEPRIKLLLLLLGLIAMGWGYYIALTTDSPLRALNNLFIAIILVMLGTYFLFMAGTIAVLKILKAKKSYYYHPEHMMAVSGLLYRMKQNAVGLASICIMSTAILVMLSTTVSLYAGIDDSIGSIYQHDIYLRSYDDSDTGLFPYFMETIEKYGKKKNISLSLNTENFLELGLNYENGNYSMQWDGNYDLTGTKELNDFVIMSAEEYGRLTGRQLNLTGNQVMYRGISDNADNELKNFSIEEEDFTCVGHVDEVPVRKGSFSIFEAYFMVTTEEKLNQLMDMQNEVYKERKLDLQSEIKHKIVIDYKDKLDIEEMKSFEKELKQKLLSAQEKALKEMYGDSKEDWPAAFSMDSRAAAYEDFFGMIGGFLFLGILLGLVFMFATAIVIYYKQVSEGYEDRERFQIMQKVGMSRREVKKTIKTQILLVFFLPLLMAVVHLAVAFRILNLLMSIFFLPNNVLFLICAVISVVVFAVVYGIIYMVTARTYHRIVA